MPVSLLEVERILNVPSVEVGLNVYLEVEVVIDVWDWEVEIKVHDIVAVGLADTEQGIWTSCPVTELYEFWGIFTVGTSREKQNGGC